MKGYLKTFIDKMEKSDTNNQGFIEMSFSDNTKTISESFKKAIIKCGYIPRRIDEKEHNNQIVPEILFEISRSKFVIVDVTYPNYGAYYEAGYVEALWKDEEDLVNRLYRRINATVGLNK